MQTRKFVVWLFMLFFSVFAVSSTKSSLATFYILKGNAEKTLNVIVEKELHKLGFHIADAHHRVNDQYEVKYGSTELDILSFLPVVPDDLVMELFKLDTRIGGFSPFNMLIYKKKGQDKTYLGHLNADAIFAITGVENQEVQARFRKALETLDQTVETYLKTHNIPFEKKIIPYQNATTQTMIHFSYTFDRGEEFDIDEFMEEFQNKFELAFINRGYLIAGYHNFFETDNGEEILEDTFDAAWSYSLCHLKYSYGVFDGAKGRPDGGLFAPCTMFIMIPKGGNTLYVMMPTLSNVKHTLSIKEPSLTTWMDRLDREIPSILHDFGMVATQAGDPLKVKLVPLPKQPLAFDQLTKKVTEKSTPKVDSKAPLKSKETSLKDKDHSAIQKTQKIQAGDEVIEITIPKPPIPPKPLKVITTYEGKQSNANDAIIDHSSRAIRFSKRMPPNYTPPQLRNQEKVGDSSATVGDVNYGKVSVYLRGKYIDTPRALMQLKQAGFQVLSQTFLDKKKQLEVIVFTHPHLLEMARKNDNGFGATLRLLIDHKEKKIHITNPLYIAKAFIQSDFDENRTKKILEALNGVFVELHNSTDTLKYSALPRYRFMKGMPSYHDTIEIASGKELVQKLKSKSNVAFVLPISHEDVLAGVTFSKRTQGFIKKIGTQNSALLPYPVLIKKDKAVILDPKYYIAVMYPDLKMSQFMTIATIPGAIEKECRKLFK